MSYYGNAGYGEYFSDMSDVRAMGSMQGGVADGGTGAISTDIPLSSGVLAAFGTSGYPGEPSLIEELGVNFGHISQKTLAVLHPFSRKAISEELMEDSDLAGPILFFLLFGTFLLLGGKANFGYIYGLGLIGTLLQYGILNMMASKHIEFIKTMSILGYCMLPLVFTAALGAGISLNNVAGYVIGALVIAWCTFSASAFFVAYLHLSDMRALVAYPLALFYGVFSLLALFQEGEL